MKKVKIVALGDSITKGVVMNEQNNYSVAEQNFIEILRQERDLEIVNFGRFGCTINYGHQVVERHASEIASADYTILEYGGNDCDFYWKRIASNPEAEHHPKTSLSSFHESMVSLIGKINSLGSHPIILSLPPINSRSYFDFFSRGIDDTGRKNILGWMGGDVEAIARWHEDYNHALFEIANETNTPILDITHPFENYPSDWHTLICPDGIHPNPAGHRLIANSIISASNF